MNAFRQANPWVRIDRRVVLLTVAAMTFGLVGGLAAQAAPGDPIGSLDSISIRASNGQTEPTANDRFVSFAIFGWAADPNSDGGYTDIHLYVDGRIVEPGWYSRHDRPDVRRVHPWVGESAGWEASVSWPAGTGAHRVCAYALNQGAGQNNTSLGCVTVPTGRTTTGDPVGHLDVVDTAPGLVRVVGWAGDPDSGLDDQGRRQATNARVYYDGYPMTEVVASNPRPDVERAHPTLGASTGFDATLPIPPGRHQVCLYALNLGRTGLQNTTVGCSTVTVPTESPALAAEVRGSLDEIRHEGAYFSDLAYARGWAYDPDGDTTITVFSLTYSDFGRWSHLMTHWQTDRPRPDVAAIGGPPDSGFEAQIGGGKYFVRIRLACALAGEIAAGGAPTGRTRLLGCRGE